MDTYKLKTDKPYYIFVSDIHGNKNTLQLIDQARHDYPIATLVGGGDYIDGRKNAKDVIEYLMHRKNAIILRGNHEQMMLNFADGLDYYDSNLEPLWYANGGKKTVRSFFKRQYRTVKAQKLVKNSKYYEYFNSLAVMLDTPHYIFVHAGVKPRVNYDSPNCYTSDKYDVNNNPYMFYRLWAREDYWNDETGFFAHNLTGKTIVTGHTPTSLIHGKFKIGQTISTRPFTKNIPLKIQYHNEPARWFTDGGSHSTYKNNWGNVCVFDNQGRLIKVYNYENQRGKPYNEQIH